MCVKGKKQALTTFRFDNSVRFICHLGARLFRVDPLLSDITLRVLFSHLEYAPEVCGASSGSTGCGSWASGPYRRRPQIVQTHSINAGVLSLIWSDRMIPWWSLGHAGESIITMQTYVSCSVGIWGVALYSFLNVSYRKQPLVRPRSYIASYLLPQTSTHNVKPLLGLIPRDPHIVSDRKI